MAKIIKKTGRFFLRFTGGVLEWALILIILLAFAIRTSAFQTWLAQRATDYLSDELGTEVRVKKVDIKFIDNMVLEEVYIEDQQGDTLIYAPTINAKVHNYSLRKKFFHIESVELNQPRIKVRKYEGKPEFNYDFLVDYFAGEDDDDTTAGPWDIKLHDLIIEDALISYRDEDQPYADYGFDHNFVFARVDAHVSDFDQDGDDITMRVHHLGVADKSGFACEHLSGNLRVMEGGFSIDTLDLRTNQSQLTAAPFELKAKSWADFSDFIDKVKIRAEFLPGSSLHMGDIAYFSEDLYGIKTELDLQGTVRGTVGTLKAQEMSITLDDTTTVTGDFDFNGLPNIDETFMAFSIDSLNTTMDKVAAFDLPPFDGTNRIDLPENLPKLGEVEVSGSFMGFINDFVAFADVGTDLGRVKTDIVFKQDLETGAFAYNGNLQAFNFNAGYMYDIPTMGAVTCKLHIDTGYGLRIEDLYGEVSGEIAALDLNGYTYNNFKINKGAFTMRYFDGDIHLRDPNIQLDYDGRVDFTNPRVPKFDFVADIRNAHLGDLNFTDHSSDASLCLGIKVEDVKGSTLDDFQGLVTIDNLSFHEQGKDIELYQDVILNTVRDGDSTSLKIFSELIDVDIAGYFKFDNLQHSFMYMASTVVPALIPEEELSADFVDDEFTFEFKIHDLSPLAEFLEEDFSVTPGTYFSGSYNSLIDFIDLVGYSEQIIYEDYYVNDFVPDILKQGDAMFLDLKASEIHVGDSLVFHNFVMGLTPWDDMLDVHLSWDDEFGGRNNIAGAGILYDADSLDFQFAASNFTALGRSWKVHERGLFVLDEDSLSFTDMKISTGDEAVMLHGRISPDPKDELHLMFDHFNVDYINPLLALDSISFYGLISGTASVSNVFDVPHFTSDLFVDTFRINKSYVGDMNFTSVWNPQRNSIDFSGDLDHGEYKSVQFNGGYFINALPPAVRDVEIGGLHFEHERPNDSLAVTFNLQDMDLGVVNEFLPSEDIADFHAYAHGDLSFRGRVDDPQMSGKLHFEEGQMKVVYLNTRYYFNGDIDIEEEIISIHSMPIYDEEAYLLDLGENALMSGALVHSSFSDMSYDFTMDFNRMMLMNTDYDQNPLFYGQAFATGRLSVFGYDDKIEITMNAETDKGTVIKLPLYGADEVVFQDFVRFITNDTGNVDKYKIDLEDITMDFGLDVTEDAEVHILFDPAIGDVMVGSAEGHLDMGIDELGNFGMFGTLEIVRGEYLFTMYNVINKHFLIEPGGTISWQDGKGDPYKATVDLTTNYRTKAPLYNLVTLEDPKYKKKTQVNCYMRLKEDLYNPELSFDIDVASVDPNVTAALDKVRGDQDELTKQFFSLMVINNFVAQGGTGYFRSAGTATTADLINNQLSNMLQDLSDEFELGFNYSPGDQLSQEEISVAFETQLLNDRLLVSGNFGAALANESINSGTSLIGDFSVEYMINEDGSFRVKGYNETNEFDLTNTTQSPYTQGVGVYYTEEFDKLSDIKLIQKIKGFFKRRKERREQKKLMKQQATTTEESGSSSSEQPTD